MPLYLLQPLETGEGGGVTFWHYGRAETNQTNVTHKRHTLFSECTVLTDEFRTLRKHFLFYCQSDEKVALPEKREKKK